MTSVALVWMRRDLRLADNPALHRASAVGPVIPVYIHAPEEEGGWTTGAAARWWLHHSLDALAVSLARRGSRLIILRGQDSLQLLRRLVRETGARTVLWNRRYEPLGMAVDRRVKRALREDGLRVESLPGNLLWEPWEVRRRDGGPFRSFTPFWRACNRLPLPASLPAPPMAAPERWPESLPPKALGLLPRTPWFRGLEACWRPGEPGAQEALAAFTDQALDAYPRARDLPAEPATSRLSPHLHFGEVSPRQIRESVDRTASADASASFLAQLGWREFAHHLLYHHPHMPDEPLDRRFRDFPWAAEQDAALAAWQSGQTGIPMVDAGMRQLWKTGWMHNRVRMIVGSLLVKNLRIPWQRGASWFWDTLVDADLANNSMGWQWVQGSGADAAPYFRIFNPVRQAERFDPRGDYIRRWVPELRQLSAPAIHAPWRASASTLRQAGITLGSTYPHPLVDLAESRRAALTAYQSIRGG
ncbi:MAG: deoxyribodipyrimidine photo-lyase [Ectothiorhodospiraceae bacterium]|nr:deoxyribodipyrimidine photo-lyase [Ectothiorhodospiraceae bacterium]